MLPDLLSMAGIESAALESIDAESVRLGIRFHYSTDEAFHGSARFRSLMAWTRHELRQTGLPRGPSLAVSHLSVELFLDGWLASDREGLSAFRDALDSGVREDDLAAFGTLNSTGARAARWRSACARLAAGPLPFAYREPDFVAERVTMALSGRPRLRVHTRFRSAVGAFLRSLRDPVFDVAAAMVGDVESVLRASAAIPSRTWSETR